jgi:hypothetical protein
VCEPAVRFDRLEPIWIAPEAGVEGEPTLGRHGGKFALTPQHTIIWRPDGLYANVRAPDYRNVGAIRPFDVRLIGCLGWARTDRAFKSGESWEEYFAHVENQPADEVATEEDLIRLTWLHSPDEPGGVESRHDLWLDPQRGFCPVRHEVARRRSGGDLDWSDAVVDRIEVNWRKIDEVWVPMDLIQERPRTVPQRRELQFVWHSVNQPIDPSVFTLDGMEYPPRRGHVDRRHGKPVFVRRNAVE